MDLLKIVCMLMIVTLHFISHGGMGTHFPQGSVGYFAVQLLRSACICAVNVFILISGYFLIGKKGLNIKRLLSIVLVIWFYAWGCFILTRIFGIAQYGFKETITSLFPISFKLYWFPTCYLCMYILSPFLNSFLERLSKKAYASFVLLLFLLLSVWNELVPTSDPLNVVGGYSIAWFLFLYCLAGFIRLHGEGFCKNWSSRRWLLLFLLSVFAIFAVDAVLALLSTKIPLIVEYGLARHFSRYCSILVLAESVCLFMLFKSISVNGVGLQKGIITVSSLTFGVYLLHDNANIRSFLYQDILHLDTFPNGPLAVLMMLGCIVLVFAACCLVEYIRKMVSSLFTRSGWYNRLCEKWQNRLNDVMYND